MRRAIGVGTILVALIAGGHGMGAEPPCCEPPRDCCLNHLGPVGGWNPGGGLLRGGSAIAFRAAVLRMTTAASPCHRFAGLPTRPTTNGGRRRSVFPGIAAERIETSQRCLSAEALVRHVAAEQLNLLFLDAGGRRRSGPAGWTSRPGRSATPCRQAVGHTAERPATRDR